MEQAVLRGVSVFVSASGGWRERGQGMQAARVETELDRFVFFLGGGGEGEVGWSGAERWAGIN